MNSAHCALVIGLCSHGLAITRSLRAKGIEVHAFEANTEIPGYRTNSAIVHKVRSIKQDSLIQDLLSFRATIPAERKIVLFPTNDNNVTVVAENIAQLQEPFCISWAHSAHSVKELLLKSNIEKQSVNSGLLYPQSFIAEELAAIDRSIYAIPGPFIVKPVTPQSGFKALKFDSAIDLIESMEHYIDDFPVLIQQWIDGTAEDLYFCALYLDHGVPITDYVGRKLESYPPALGQTTVAVSCHEPELVDLTAKFFANTDISGPVSLEFKKDSNGRYWVIEPTLGRSDFWLGLCTASGCDLPCIEYSHASGQKLTSIAPALKRVLWFDSERDPSAPFRFLTKWLIPGKNHYYPIFSYFAKDDPAPFFRSSYLTVKRLALRVREKYFSRGKASESDAGKVVSYSSLDTLPENFKALLRQCSEDYLFYDLEWFKNLSDHAASYTGSVEILCLSDPDGSALAVLPLWKRTEEFHRIRLRKIGSLSNYYTPRFDVFVDSKKYTRERAIAVFFKYIATQSKNWDVIEFNPMLSSSIEEIAGQKKPSFSYYITENYIHPIDTDYSGYLSSRPSRLKNTIRRKLKKLEAADSYSFDINLGDKKINSTITNYHDVYTHSWKIDEPFPEFINGLVELGAKRGWLRLGSLTIDDVVVASQIWLVANGTAYIYKLAYDRDYSEYSPGTLLTNEMFRYAIDVDHVKRVDFLHGNDSFKKDWMATSISLYGIQYPNPKTARGLLLLLINAATNIRKKLQHSNK